MPAPLTVPASDPLVVPAVVGAAALVAEADAEGAALAPLASWPSSVRSARSEANNCSVSGCSSATRAPS